MTLTIHPGPLRGALRILPSKSHLHRLLICAALAEGETRLLCADTQAEDILCTIACLEALGAQITREADGFRVRPLQRDALPEWAILPCGESGSTLRFLLPVVCALGVRVAFHRKGRLPLRPLAPLDAQLIAKGCRLWEEPAGVLCCEGQLLAGDFTLPGDISSQYISGLLFALPLLEGSSRLHITGSRESWDYVTLTEQVLLAFGLSVLENTDGFDITGAQRPLAPASCQVEGDWSNAAFWLCAAALSGGDLRVQGLSLSSTQGDRAICAILSKMGAQVDYELDAVHVCADRLLASTVDARAIPDLIPALACVMAVSRGESQITNAARLRLKESDRLHAVRETLHALGAQVEEGTDMLRITGCTQLRGGSVDAFSDHRIAMLAALASCASREPIRLTGAEAVRKSYPDFWQCFSALGGRFEEVSV